MNVSEQMKSVSLRGLLREMAITILLFSLVVASSIAVIGPTGAHQHGQLKALSHLALFLGPLLLFAILERFVSPAGEPRSPRVWLLHLQFNLVYLLAAAGAGALAAGLTSALGQHFELGRIDVRFASGKGLLSLLAAFILVMFVRDFCYYWYHRGLHKFPILWQIHKLHHMDPNIDVLSNFREGWIDAFGQTLLISIPLTLIFKFDDLSPIEVGAVGGALIAGLGAIAGNIIHFNCRLHFGRASAVICGPQLHRIHHSVYLHHRETNFCAMFPIWDVIFGTYYAPAPDEWPPTGVDEEREIDSLWEFLIFTPREWWKMYLASRERRASKTAIGQ
jgi:sterol desaturase/sphingolipid hydroxylase (fatty acid hydroxylase superfamily)